MLHLDYYQQMHYLKPIIAHYWQNHLYTASIAVAFTTVVIIIEVIVIAEAGMLFLNFKRYVDLTLFDYLELHCHFDFDSS